MCGEWRVGVKSGRDLSERPLPVSTVSELHRDASVRLRACVCARGLYGLVWQSDSRTVTLLVVTLLVVDSFQTRYDVTGPNPPTHRLPTGAEPDPRTPTCSIVANLLAGLKHDLGILVGSRESLERCSPVHIVASWRSRTRWPASSMILVGSREPSSSAVSALVENEGRTP